MLDKKIECDECGWSWLESETEPHDKYICHKCGNNTLNENYMISSSKKLVNKILNEVYDLQRRYLEGYIDSEELLGEHLWFHTNRTNERNGYNGMIGIYTVNSNGMKDKLTKRYTNEVRIKSPIVFQTSISGAKRIQKSIEVQGGEGTRQLIAGVSGVVIETNSGNISGMSKAQYNPKDPIAPWFYLIGDEDKKEILSASEVYFVANPNGKWDIYVKNPEFNNQQLELF